MYILVTIPSLYLKSNFAYCIGRMAKIGKWALCPFKMHLGNHFPRFNTNEICRFLKSYIFVI